MLVKRGSVIVVKLTGVGGLFLLVKALENVSRSCRVISPSEEAVWVLTSTLFAQLI